MSTARPDETDSRLEQLLGNLLRWGVVAAAMIVLIGGILYVMQHGGAPADHRMFHGEPAELRSPVAIFSSAAKLDSHGLIQLGLLLLILTPILRVAFSAFAFFKQQDYVYVTVTIIVLALLCCSLSSGFRDNPPAGRQPAASGDK